MLCEKKCTPNLTWKTSFGVEEKPRAKLREIHYIQNNYNIVNTNSISSEILEFPRNSQCILTTLLEFSLTLYITISLKYLTLGNASSVGYLIPRLKAFIYSKQRGLPFLHPLMWDFERHNNNSSPCLSFHKY